MLLIVPWFPPAEDHSKLSRFILAFENSCPNLVVRVPEWGVGGGVYAHYLSLRSDVEEMRRSQLPTKSKVCI